MRQKRRRRGTATSATCPSSSEQHDVSPSVCEERTAQEFRATKRVARKISKKYFFWAIIIRCLSGLGHCKEKDRRNDSWELGPRLRRAECERASPYSSSYLSLAPSLSLDHFVIVVHFPPIYCGCFCPKPPPSLAVPRVTSCMTQYCRPEIFSSYFFSGGKNGINVVLIVSVDHKIQFRHKIQ